MTCKQLAEWDTRSLCVVALTRMYSCVLDIVLRWGLCIPRSTASEALQVVSPQIILLPFSLRTFSYKAMTVNSFVQRMALISLLVPGVNKLFLKLPREIPVNRRVPFSCPTSGWPVTTSTNRDLVTDFLSKLKSPSSEQQFLDNIHLFGSLIHWRVFQPPCVPAHSRTTRCQLASMLSCRWRAHSYKFLPFARPFAGTVHTWGKLRWYPWPARPRQMALKSILPSVCLVHRSRQRALSTKNHIV